MAEPEQDTPTERRTGFGPVVLSGLASGALAAVAGTRAWVEGSSGQLSTETAGEPPSSGPPWPSASARCPWPEP